MIRLALLTIGVGWVVLGALLLLGVPPAVAIVASLGAIFATAGLAPARWVRQW